MMSMMMMMMNKMMMKCQVNLQVLRLRRRRRPSGIVSIPAGSNRDFRLHKCMVGLRSVKFACIERISIVPLWLHIDDYRTPAVC